MATPEPFLTVRKGTQCSCCLQGPRGRKISEGFRSDCRHKKSSGRKAWMGARFLKCRPKDFIPLIQTPSSTPLSPQAWGVSQLPKTAFPASPGGSACLILYDSLPQFEPHSLKTQAPPHLPAFAYADLSALHSLPSHLLEWSCLFCFKTQEICHLP